MTSKTAGRSSVERWAWWALLACVTLMPLAVTKFPFSRRPLTFETFLYPQNLALTILLSVTALLWAVALLRRETRVLYAAPMAAFGVFVLWAGVSSAFGYAPVRSILGGSLSTLAFVNLVQYAALGFLAVQLVTTSGRMKSLTWAVIGTSTLVAIIAIIQQQTHATVFGLPQAQAFAIDRGSSTIGNPDQLGTFLVVSVVLSGFLAVFEREKRPRLIALGAFAVTLLALVSTLTRGAWIGAACGAAIGLLLLWRVRRIAEYRRRALLLACVGLAIVAVALVSADPTRLATRFQAPASSTDVSSAASSANALSSGRVDLWRSALAVTAERPLTGTGPAAFELGWYRHAIRPTSGGGSGAVATDPHSFLLYVLATVGIVGFLALVAGLVWVFLLGARSAMGIMRDRSQPLSPGAVYYIGWLAAAVCLQVALLVAAVSPPIVAYAFLSLGIILRPLARDAERLNAAGAMRSLFAGAAIVAAVALFVAELPTARAEFALAPMTVAPDRVVDARSAVDGASWNMDVQRSYFYLRALQANAALQMASPNAPGVVESVATELRAAGLNHPHEAYYPAARSQLLQYATTTLGDAALARETIAAADEALAIMPSNLAVRVNKALALSTLERFEDAASTLAGYWQNELGSAYPGIVYAQALAFSERQEQAEEVFASLKTRFPGESDVIAAAEQQVAEDSPQVP